LRAAHSVLVAHGPLAVQLIRLAHGRVVVRNATVDQPAHEVRPLGHQQDILDPVRAGPAGGVARFKAHGPRHVAVRHHLLHQGIQFLPRGGNGVAQRLKVHRRVPHDGLDVALHRQADPLAIHRAGFHPAAAIDVGIYAQLVDVDQLVSILLELHHIPESDIGGRAGLHARIQQSLVARGLGLQDDTAGIHQGLEDGQYVLFFHARPLVEHRHCVALLGVKALDVTRGAAGRFRGFRHLFGGHAGFSRHRLGRHCFSWHGLGGHDFGRDPARARVDRRGSLGGASASAGCQQQRKDGE